MPQMVGDRSAIGADAAVRLRRHHGREIRFDGAVGQRIHERVEHQVREQNLDGDRLENGIERIRRVVRADAQRPGDGPRMARLRRTGREASEGEQQAHRDTGDTPENGDHLAEYPRHDGSILRRGRKKVDHARSHRNRRSAA
jgi:hypothetical protein